MAKANPRTQVLADDLPLKLLEIVLTAFLISTFLIMILRMREAEYDVTTFPFNCAPIYIPIVYTTWIYAIGYKHKTLLSEKSMRYLLYLASFSAVVISLAQIQEFGPLFEEQMELKEFINKYMEITALHPLFTAFIIALLFYLRLIILNERAYFSFFVNSFLIVALMIPVRKNIPTVFWSLAQISGLWHDGINYATLTLVLFFACLFLVEAFYSFLKKFRKKY